MKWQFFNRHETASAVLFWVIIALTQTWVNAESQIADYERLGQALAPWQPYLWESSSQIMSIILIPLILYLDRHFPLGGPNLRRGIIGHVGISIVFSVCHVVGMVMLRKLTYFALGGHYDFGNWFAEFIYEYRKDAYSYVWIIAVIYAYRFIVSRLRGEATVITVGEDTPLPKKPERLLVKKLGKEFIVKVSDVEWIEAAGNYVNLHLNGRIYPLRETMVGVEEKLDEKKFARIHRSYIVNLDQIREIEPLESGDYRVRLIGGESLNFSRRYRGKIKGLME